MPAAARRVARLAAVCAFALGGAGAASAAAAGIGFQDQSYAPLGSSPSGTKPESKLWFNNGWWASMFNPAAGAYRIYKLNTATGALARHRRGDRRPRRHARRRALDAARQALRRLAHAPRARCAATAAANSGRLYRFSYTPATDSYRLDPGFPVTINAATTETLVIDQDSTGTLWATWTQGSHVFVNHSTGGNDATWGTPFIVPGAGTSLTSDDISSLIHFGANKIGVMWSNQADHHVYFAVHVDGTTDRRLVDAPPSSHRARPPTTTSTSRPTAPAACTPPSRPARRTKTRPLILLLGALGRTATWSAHDSARSPTANTRPIVLLDEQHGLDPHVRHLPAAARTSGQSGGDICEKTRRWPARRFAPGIGTPVISDAGSPDMNDATSTKQNVDSTTGIVVMANNARARHLLAHRGVPRGR